MHFVYIIQSLQSGILYKGYSLNPANRLHEHNNDLSRFTAGKGPWKLAFLCSFESKSEALKFELMLKKQNRKYLEWLINSDRNLLYRE